MTVRDLQTIPPRRWSEQLDGIYWLPRLTDKARAALGGTLGDYIYGQSPMDRGLLRTLRLSHREFASIVRDAVDDVGVLAAIAAHDPEALQRARVWSEALPEEHRLFFWFVDVDDGYRSTWLRRPIAVAANVISRTAKRLWPSRAAERAAAGE